MTKTFKFALLSIALIFLIASVLWYPYKSGVVPEWRIQVIDAGGHPVVGISVIEEWLDPLEEGMTPLEIRETDTQGFVVFPGRPLHNRLAFGLPPNQPAAHVYMCGEGQYGQAFWDAKDRELITKLELKKSACPFG
jgi:hypothetical protein